MSLQFSCGQRDSSASHSHGRKLQIMIRVAECAFRLKLFPWNRRSDCTCPILPLLPRFVSAEVFFVSRDVYLFNPLAAASLVKCPPNFPFHLQQEIQLHPRHQLDCSIRLCKQTRSWSQLSGIVPQRSSITSTNLPPKCLDAPLKPSRPPQPANKC